MRVRDVMTAGLVTVRPEASFRDVVERLLARDVSGIPVVGDDGTLIGLITEADLLSKEAYGPPRHRRSLGVLLDILGGREPPLKEKAVALTSRDLMTAPVETVSPDDDLRFAARRMLDCSVKRLPVVDAGKLVGIVSRADILGTFRQSDEDLQAAVERLLLRSLYTRPEHEVSASVVDGVVTLNGEVQFESDSRVAAAIVWTLPGVVGVENRLTYRSRDPRGMRPARV